MPGPRAANTETSFGWVTRLLHWVMAVGVLLMLALGSYVARMEVSLSNLWLFGLHKSIGLCLLVLLILRLAWHVRSPPPKPMSDGIAWHDRLAALVHRAFYVLLLAVPLTGWIASVASGLDVVLFGRWVLPRIAPVAEPWELAFFAAHNVLTKLLLACVILHVAGALTRRDGTLQRIVVGYASATDTPRKDQ